MSVIQRTPLTDTDITMEDNSDPDMSEVISTLRILSQRSILRINKSLKTTESHIQCTNCNHAAVIRQRSNPTNREQIMRNLAQLEQTLESRGEKLPTWVEAYKVGDSIKAAKLLHLSYMNRKRAPGTLKRKSVQETTSMVNEEALVSQSTQSVEIEQDEIFYDDKRKLMSYLE